MMLTIHQPEFMPYGGFMAKALRSELFILLDSVQFAKNNWQNRNRLLIGGEPRWVTIPVAAKGRLEGTIAETEVIANGWQKKLLGTLQANYRHHPCFGEVFPFFEELCSREQPLLAPLNEAIIRFMAARLGCEAQWVRSSELDVDGSRSDLLAALSAKVGGAVYLSGAGGRSYLQAAPFEEVGVAVKYHDFHAQPYPQPGVSEFVPNLSVVDLLFCCSPEQARENLLAGSEISDV